MLIRLPNLSDLLSGSSSPQQNVCTHLGFSCFTLFFTEVVSTCVRVHECVSKRPPPRWKPRCGFLSLVAWLHFKKQNSTWPTSEVKWLTVFFLQGTPKACKKCETERKSRERLLLILYKMHEHNHEDVIYSLFFPCFTCVNRKCLHDGIHLPQYISPPNNTCSEVCLILFEIITQNHIVALSLGTPVCFSIGFYWINPSYVAKTKSEREV